MLRYPASFAHGSFLFNEQFNADGTANTAKVRDTATIDRAIVSPSFRDLREPLHLAQGGTFGRVHKGIKVIHLRGRILVPDASQAAKLADRERAMRAAFDPYLCDLDSPSTDGAYAFEFSSPTLDTATYASGRIDLRYYARPADQPVIDEAVGEAGRKDYSLILLAADPRAYERTEQTLEHGVASSIVNRGTTPAPCKVRITMSAAGNASTTITVGSLTFIVDLSGLVNNDVVEILMETSAPYGRGRRVTLNGSDAFSRKVSGPTSWFSIPVGTTAGPWTISPSTGVASAVLHWYSARA